MSTDRKQELIKAYHKAALKGHPLRLAKGGITRKEVARFVTFLLDAECKENAESDRG